MGSAFRVAVRAMGRSAPSTLRFLAQHNSIDRIRWPMVSALLGDAKCRDWLARLENPTKTRQGFKIFTIPGDLTSDWIKLHGRHEAGTERFILDHLKTDSTFLDIGANIGYFSLLAAIVAKAKVVSFEPQRTIADLLVRSAACNGADGSIRVERLALSNAPAMMRMTSCPGNTGHSRLANTGDKCVLPYLVPVVVLDEWLRGNQVGPVSVCKIDTEGSELCILEGMPQLLERDAPAVVIEVVDEFLAEFGASRVNILELLRGRGYDDVSDRYRLHGDCNRYFVSGRAVQARANSLRGSGRPDRDP